MIIDKNCSDKYVLQTQMSVDAEPFFSEFGEVVIGKLPNNRKTA